MSNASSFDSIAPKIRRTSSKRPTDETEGAPGRRIVARAAARAVLLDAPHPDTRGAPGGALPADEGRRWPVPFSRPGSRRGREQLRARAPRHHVAAHPKPRIDAREGRDATGSAPPVHGQG